WEVTTRAELPAPAAISNCSTAPSREDMSVIGTPDDGVASTVGAGAELPAYNALAGASAAVCSVTWWWCPGGDAAVCSVTWWWCPGGDAAAGSATGGGAAAGSATGGGAAAGSATGGDAAAGSATGGGVAGAGNDVSVTSEWTTPVWTPVCSAIDKIAGNVAT